MKLTLLTLILVSSIALSGCTHEEKSVRETPSTRESSGTVAVAVVPPPGITTTLSLASITLASSGAPNTQDRTGPQIPLQDIMNAPRTSCENLKSTSQKERCTDMATLNKAFSEQDIRLCRPIQGKDILRKCIENIIGISSLGDTLSPCESLTDRDMQRSCMDRATMTRAVSQGYMGICSEVSDPKLEPLCKNNVIISKALKKKDTSICLELADEELRDSCKKLIM